MKKRWIIIFASVLLLTLAWVGTVHAQEEPGYPVDTETPTETAVPTETKPPTETSVPTETTVPPERETPTETPPATIVPSETSVPTVTPTETPNLDNPVCSGSRVHPVLAGLASRFDVPYETLLGYFCNDNLGVGEIALALFTAQHSDGGVDLPTLISQRLDQGLGWGQIWQGLGMIGNGNGQGDETLKKNQDRNQHQDQITNQGENDLIQNQADYTEQKGKPLNSPPGLEDKDKETGQPGSPPGQEGKNEDGKPGNGPKP